MTADREQQRRARSQRDRQIERECRQGRKFSIADLISQEGGGDFLKGASPVPPLLQAKTEIKFFIEGNLPDTSGILQAALYAWVADRESLVSQHLDLPLMALQQVVAALLDNPQLLYEFVRQVDVRWGQTNDERPYFQKPGQPAHPEDEYTHASVRQQLEEFFQKL